MLFHFKVVQNQAINLKSTLSRIFIPSQYYCIYFAIQVGRNLAKTVNFTEFLLIEA